ncbi:sugar nucleotide-binding protein [Aestuariicella hydrocarbonica]|uniref:dTDP-4-dehydrorhamnose reductase n=1 Tax=Pseudomaricurvus hydrocarbonicus TaxID=1470433 RepID=A0A9E5MKA0_9GAMM|nr:sugar nucleotide-binding protein [Aestuariicella hydrocarbonica]
MARKILITDAFSSVGRAIYSVFQSSAYAVLSPPLNSLDWTDVASVQQYLVDNTVDVVINTAGWNEAPNKDQQLTLVQAATALATAAPEAGCVVIHLSSYRVFGGENKSSYDEDDVPVPLNAAGQAFLDAERAFEARMERYLCVRVSWVLDIIGESIFWRLLKDLTSEGPELEITHQRRGAPLSSAEIGRVILAMTHQILCGAENWGVFHLASGDPCSSADVAEAVSDILQREQLLKRQWRVETLSEEQLAKLGEPDSAALTVRRCRDNFGYQICSWRQGLTGLVRAWLVQQRLLPEKAAPSKIT